MANEDPIDAALDQCLSGDAANTDAGMLSCTETAYAAWDKRLNTAYQALMKQLDPASQNLLRDAQRSWVAYRDKDTAFSNGPWRANTGTDAQLSIASTQLDDLRARVHMLEVYGSGE